MRKNSINGVRDLVGFPPIPQKQAECVGRALLLSAKRSGENWFERKKGHPAWRGALFQWVWGVCRLNRIYLKEAIALASSSLTSNTV
jgi:hypothetical protein